MRPDGTDEELTGVAPAGPGSLRLWPPRSVRLTLAVLAVAVVGTGYLDYRTGPSVSLGGVYLFIVAAGSVIGGPRAGTALAGTAVLVDALADAVVGLPPRHPTESAANALLLLAVLVVAVAVAEQLRSWTAAAVQAERRSRAFLLDATRQLMPQVSALRATAERALRPDAGTAVADSLVDVVRIAERSGRLVDRVLLAARLDQDGTVTLAPTDVLELCRRELETHRIERPDCTWDLESPSSELRPGELDSKATQAIVADLLDDAGRRAATRVTLVVSVVGDELTVLVRSDGGLERASGPPGPGRDWSGDAVRSRPSSAAALARALGGRVVDSRAGIELHLPYRPVSA